MAAKKKVMEEAVEEVKVEDQEGVEDVAKAISYNYPDIIRESLLKTGREGVVDLINYMDRIGFFKAPCSGANHLCKEGGLAEHSVNVMWAAEKLSVALIGGKNMTDEIRNSVIIAALLHDLGKAGDYGKSMYVANILKSGKQSDAKPYKRNPALLPLDHATRSIKLATLFIDLTEDEEFAIRYHDGLYESANYAIKGHETQLYMILHWADMWASHVIEGGSDSEESEE